MDVTSSQGEISPKTPQAKSNTQEASSSKGKTFSETLQQEPQHFTKNISDSIIYIGQEDISIMDNAWALKQKYLENSCYPTLINKPRLWLQILLMRDVEITHFYPNGSPSNPPNFSKCIIKNALKPKEWGISTNRVFPIKHGNETYSFNYWDYISAFYNTFFF